LCRLELLVYLGQVLLAVCNFVALLRCALRNNNGWCRFLDTIGGGGGLVLEIFFLLRLLGKITEDVVENEVAVGLLSKNKSLGETLVGMALVGDLANDLDDNVGLGALGVNVGDADLGVLEIKELDALVDGLRLSASMPNK
jgi:hypothetical protein